ncbi:hypothetical protein PGTUg99_010503 [Puccinia graminis f. sp. tritici]|uniref:Secreted protein n=1 Tax=Puccinia graminis f. sp. tritici TaxID=56615 RepID=A0A5B0M1T8_PUCGR|nr:hypothetical protein PGTUg99_010503 [Puccinia graminis f. sp. tritici]
MQFALAIAVCLSFIYSSIASPVIIDKGKYRIDTNQPYHATGFRPPNQGPYPNVDWNQGYPYPSNFGFPSSYSYADLDAWYRQQQYINSGPGYINGGSSTDQGYNFDSGSGTYFAKEAKPEHKGKADAQ